MTYLCDNIGATPKGHLTFAGLDTVELANTYGTPLYLLDEDRIRAHCRAFRDAFAKHFPAGSLPLYAGKANAFSGLYKILKDEGMGIDVVSAGEIYLAKRAGFDLSLAFFHGNNKTDADIDFALECGVGYFVADNREEIEAIESIASRRGIKQKILLRLTPGIDPHTYEAVNTGRVDSKFGIAIATGQADEIVALTLQKEHIELCGFHCHVGSQVFYEDVFERAVDVMLAFAASARKNLGYTAKMLDLGGGFGVRYTEKDPKIDPIERLASIAERFHTTCASLDFPEPRFFMEPGRSIVADAGMTLYTVGSVKPIPGYKTYVSIDGGMADNPRYALYRSAYTLLAANKQNETHDKIVTVAGRCCESGDLIQENVPLPASIEKGDIVAVCTTGAYNDSMASDYNKLLRPPVVLIKNKIPRLALRRGRFEDLGEREEF